MPRIYKAITETSGNTGIALAFVAAPRTLQHLSQVEQGKGLSRIYRGKPPLPPARYR
ncbi:MAG: hypothetical protein HY299_16645 [Verrucomicrobia bacterium]|nr:hypothetical protein [Verrucomicrobiota bacterium]